METISTEVSSILGGNRTLGACRWSKSKENAVKKGGEKRNKKNRGQLKENLRGSMFIKSNLKLCGKVSLTTPSRKEVSKITYLIPLDNRKSERYIDIISLKTFAELYSGASAEGVGELRVVGGLVHGEVARDIVYEREVGNVIRHPRSIPSKMGHIKTLWLTTMKNNSYQMFHQTKLRSTTL